MDRCCLAYGRPPVCAGRAVCTGRAGKARLFVLRDPSSGPKAPMPPGYASLILFVGGPQYSRFAANIAAPPPKKSPFGVAKLRATPYRAPLAGVLLQRGCGGHRRLRTVAKPGSAAECRRRRGTAPSPPQAHRASPQLPEARRAVGAERSSLPRPLEAPRRAELGSAARPPNALLHAHRRRRARAPRQAGTAFRRCSAHWRAL